MAELAYVHETDPLARDRGLLYGESCFETFRVAGGEVFAWPRHAARLERGLEALGVVLEASAFDALRERAVAAARRQGGVAIVRLTVTGGSGPRGPLPPDERHPTVLVDAAPPKPRPAAQLASVAWPEPLPRRSAKFACDYGLMLRDLRRVRPAGGKEEPLVCREGRVVSTLSANVLILREGRWHTPPARTRGVLPGVVRAVLLDAGAVTERDCPAAWLDSCEAAALTNSGHFVRPVGRLDGRDLDTDPARFAPLVEALAGRPGTPEHIL